MIGTDSHNKTKSSHYRNGIYFAYFKNKKREVGVVIVAQLFISHSCKDISLAKFLIHLLDYYHIKSWTSFMDPEQDTTFQQNIDSILLSCDNLLVLITKNILSSSWITSEILIFKKVNPDADIIPLIFDKKVDLDMIAPGLQQYQLIDFTQDLTNGFRTLFARYGIEFLTHSERRDGQDRRTGRERRKNSDRRSKDVTQRLQKTFLDSYLENNIVNEDNEIDLNNDFERQLFFESIKQGAKNFLCYDEIGNLYNTNFVINLCLNQALTSAIDNSQQNKARRINAKYLTFAIAKNMTEKFIVRSRDRRSNNNDRRSGSDRREICKSLNGLWNLN